MNETINQLTGVQISKNSETEGFDLQAGESWIYPTNYPVREYQFNIIQKALLKNTLVSLPTGLGKTFIAAVVMFNYFRWYPQGKVVFMAPTRPLVKQQIDACYDIMGIPREATAEITGTGTKVSTREDIWNEKRVFFITPQILQNDLDKFQSLALKIKCIVFDEAHKARGNHAYCEVIRKLSASNKYFRVLALSATPGSSVEEVLDVVHNLLISHLEFRTEESLDVSPYVFQRNLTTVVVPLGDKLQEIKDTYMKVLEYYTRTLIKYKIVQGNCANLTKGKIFMLSKNFQQKNRGTSPNYNEIMKCLQVCITLYHASELLIRHGLRSFLTFFDEHIDKPLIRGNMMVREIMEDVREYLGPLPQITKLPDGEYPEISPNVKFGHPKYYRLRDILLDHFKESDNSRVIVFFEYRESVMESYTLLVQSKPIIKPRIFVGQKLGVTQRVQINVVKSFREGSCNVLLSTCIGEEGLDVGEVDLIICFDISNKSPIRMVQRMGRTGRKKDGQIIVLVTEGKEQDTLKDCLIHKNNVASYVLGSKQLANSLLKECPRLIPEGILPKCEKIFITVQKPEAKKSANLKDMLRTLSSKSSEPSFSPNLHISDIEERIPKSQLFCVSENILKETISLTNLFNNKIEKQRNFQETHKVGHSGNCELLVNLLQMAESRRFNIPMTQINKSAQYKNLKQTDIRNMFFKSQSVKDFEMPATQIPTFLDSTPKFPDAPNIADDKYFGLPELFTEITNFLSITFDVNVKKCKLCPSQIECGLFCYKRSSTSSLNWVEPDSLVYTSITLNDLKLFEKGLDKTDNATFQFDETLDFEIVDAPKHNTTKKENAVLDLEDLIDHSILANFGNESVHFQAPKSFNNMLSKYSTSLIDEEISQKPTKVVPNNMYSEEEIKRVLNFFKLDNLIAVTFDGNYTPDSQETITYSPDIFGKSVEEKTPVKVDNKSEDSSSPILGSFITQRKKTITQIQVPEFDSPAGPNFTKREFTSTPLSQNIPVGTACTTPKTSARKESPLEVRSKPSDAEKNDFFELEDLFDFSVFGKDETTRSESSKIISLSSSYKREDFCENPVEKKPIDVSDLFDKNIESPESLDFLDFLPKQKVEDPEKKKTDKMTNKCSPSQVSVTQLLSLVNKPTQPNDVLIKDNKSPSLQDLVSTELISLVNEPTQLNTSSQKENLVNDYDSEFFEFTFNNAKVASKPLVEKSNNKLNDSFRNNNNSLMNRTLQNSSLSTTLDSSKNSLNVSNAIVSPNTKPINGNIKKSNNPTTSSAKTSKMNESRDNSVAIFSDDEFEVKPKSPVWIKPKVVAKKRKICDNNNSDDDFETNITSPVWHKPKDLKKNKVIEKKTELGKNCGSRVKRKKLVNQFIEDEAELSGCDIIDVSDDEIETQTQNHYDASFVADETQNMDTQMHAVYLKSVRSPVIQNRFKIPRKVPNINVFSQLENTEEDTYLDDSFVVHDEIVESQEELSQLEILEKKLESKRKKKKRDKMQNSKRKRIICLESDSE